MGVDGAIILDILNLIGRFFKFGTETKQSQVLVSRVPDMFWASTDFSGKRVNQASGAELR